MIIRPELRVTQSDHITVTWNNHSVCAVSRDLRVKSFIHYITYSLWGHDDD